MSPPPLYDETHRPQFHFTARRNWLNDPNGLVWFEGEYHLFFQHNPRGIRWGNMTWGHAVSPDLLHWVQLDHALEPDDLGTVFSGSAVVDWRDTGGFRCGAAPALVACFTSAGSEAPQPRPFTQSIAFSNDRGRTWTRYAGNPVLAHVRGANRDPKLIWHEPTGQWVMALYLEDHDYALFGSPDLKRWRRLCDVSLPGAGECPDFFPLAVDGDFRDTRWVFWGGNGTYALGSFDGRAFLPQTEVLRAESGANGYAAQTWSDVPPADGRRLQISWMSGGKYPAMPFNQQMSIPVELSLRSLPEGVRLCRWPVRELEALRGRRHCWQDRPLAEPDSLAPDTDVELFDVELEFEPGTAQAVGAWVRGLDLACDLREGTVSFLGRSAPLPRGADGRVRLRFLVDRTSLEVYADAGQVSMSFCLLPEAADQPLVFYARGGQARVLSLTVHELHSVWR